MEENYILLVDKIASLSGVDKTEIEKKIGARRAKLSGLISKEGAAQIIASEMGIKLDGMTFKISELVNGMKRANVVGKIINIFPVRSFEKAGKTGKVANLVIADETNSTRVVLWDLHHIELVEKGDLKIGDVVEVRNSSVRELELHLSGFSEIAKVNKQMEKIKTEANFLEKEIIDIREGENVCVRGNVVQLFSPRFFFSCPECGKKVVASDPYNFSCETHGKVSAKEKAILNLTIDDGTEIVRVVLFSDQIEKITLENNLKDSVAFEVLKKDILGKEVFVKGVVRKNKFFNNLEINVQDVSFVNPEILLLSLEKK